MCGRYTLTTDLFVVKVQFGIDQPDPMPDWHARYNIAPTQVLPVVLPDSAKGGRHLMPMRWGLIPSWAKDASIGNRMINARAESVAVKPAFKGALQLRRCVVPADGFYEWLTEGKIKTPFLFGRRDGKLLAMAGLWESWKSPDSGSIVRSFTIITTDANAAVLPVHDRMPALLRGHALETWLDPSVQDPEKLVAACSQSFPADELESRRVSRRLNSPAYDAPDVWVSREDSGS